MAKAIGYRAEDIAARYLSDLGYKILDKNLSFKFGELDLVALDKKIIVFVEVKYRRSLEHGYPFEAVHRAKQKKIILAAKAYLARHKALPLCRFDVLSLHGDLSCPKVEHIIDAFWVEQEW